MYISAKYGIIPLESSPHEAKLILLSENSYFHQKIYPPCISAILEKMKFLGLQILLTNRCKMTYSSRGFGDSGLKASPYQVILTGTLKGV